MRQKNSSYDVTVNDVIQLFARVRKELSRQVILGFHVKSSVFKNKKLPIFLKF